MRELAAHVRPAGRFLDALAVQTFESGIGVGLQDADKRGKVRSGPLALPIRGVAEEHGRRLGARGRPVIAHVGPQSSLLRRAASRTEYRDRRVIPVQLLRREDVASERTDQRLEQGGGAADPAGKRGTFDLETLSGVDLALPL